MSIYMESYHDRMYAKFHIEQDIAARLVLYEAALRCSRELYKMRRGDGYPSDAEGELIHHEGKLLYVKDSFKNEWLDFWSTVSEINKKHEEWCAKFKSGSNEDRWDFKKQLYREYEKKLEKHLVNMQKIAREESPVNLKRVSRED